jgi:Tfp pilus assembly protein PilP
MKPTMTVFVCVLVAGMAAAQNPSIIQNTRTTMNAVHDNSAAASNAALASADKTPPTTSATQAPTKGATAVKPVATSKSTAAVSATAPSKTGVMTVPVATKTKKNTHAKAGVVAPKKQGAITGTVVGGSTTEGETADKTTVDERAAPDKKWSGKRDPFVSPVVSRATGNSNCSTGKKCLEIGTINLRGVVHAESGFIAVVSNSMNKAYFLRENDPVFNGYVVRITGDSIVFQETLQDRLGKTFTREVVKKITTPAV